MGVNNAEDQDILIRALNNFPTPSAPPEDEFPPSAPFINELECIVCMDAQVIYFFIYNKLLRFFDRHDH